MVPFQLNALRAISTCSRKPENCQILHDNEIETTIMTVLGGEHPGVLAQACLTVSTMVSNPLVKETFTKVGVIQVGTLSSYPFAAYLTIVYR